MRTVAIYFWGYQQHTFNFWCRHTKYWCWVTDDDEYIALVGGCLWVQHVHKTCFLWPEFKSRFCEQYLFVKVPPRNDIDNQQLLTEKLWTKLDHWYYCPIWFHFHYKAFRPIRIQTSVVFNLSIFTILSTCISQGKPNTLTLIHIETFS